MNWKPIATAPKDGTRIVIYIPSRKPGWGVRIGYWDEQKYHKKPKPYWMYDGWEGVAEMRCHQPTHWMILNPPTN